MADETRCILVLAPVAVQPTVQRRAIGRALVPAGLTIADSMQEALVVLGHPQFYSKFGFVPSLQYAIVCPVPVPNDGFMVKLLKHFHPTYRDKVIYSPAFNGI